MNGDWKVGTFVIASGDNTHRMVGLLSGGVALDERGHFEGAPAWTLTHVATGLRIVMLCGSFGNIIGPADEIASCTDWSFTAFPPPNAARDALIAVMEKYPEIIVPGNGRAGSAADAERVQAALQ